MSFRLYPSRLSYAPLESLCAVAFSFSSKSLSPDERSEFESLLSCTFLFFSLSNTASAAMRAAVARSIVVNFFKSGFLLPSFRSFFFNSRLSSFNLRIFALFFSSSTFALLADTGSSEEKKMESLYSTLATILSTAPANPSAIRMALMLLSCSISASITILCASLISLGSQVEANSFRAFSIHGCFNNSLAVGRVDASLRKHCLRKSSHCLEIPEAGSGGISSLTILNNAAIGAKSK